MRKKYFVVLATLIIVVVSLGVIICSKGSLSENYSENSEVSILNEKK